MTTRPANDAPYRLIRDVEFGDDVIVQDISMHLIDALEPKAASADPEPSPGDETVEAHQPGD